MKKIMFNDRFGLTKAVLDGTKTMTRRVIPELLNVEDPDISEWGLTDGGKAMITLYEGGRPTTDIFPMYQPGEVVAVAQSYKSVFEESLKYVIPRYHWLDDYIDEKGYANKMFVKAGEMPHQIRITNIKVERLQDINDEDCIKEGIYVNPNPPKWREYDPYEPWHPNVKPYKFTTIKGFCKPQFAFAFFIDAISGKGTWKRNPFVFAYTFELVK